MASTYADCLRSDRESAIDVVLATKQHAAYVEAIRALGIAVDVVKSDDECPDACFIEDTAVITGAHAVATRPGAPSRRAEVDAVAAALAPYVTVHRMTGEATLDGGDVLRVGDSLFVGLSTRTNEAGVAFLAAVARRDGLDVVPLVVRGGLHLKSACSLAGASLLLFDPALFVDADLAPFRSHGLTCVAASEPVGANVLAIGTSVLVSAAAILRERGLDVRIVDVSEMHKGDGALTCLSLRAPAGGHWST